MNEQGTRWTSKTVRVDINTGEFLTQHNAETNYLHIKTLRNATLNRLKTRGTIEYTKLYRRKQQINLFE